jgi:hypothetical protein
VKVGTGCRLIVSHLLLAFSPALRVGYYAPGRW